MYAYCIYVCLSIYLSGVEEGKKRIEKTLDHFKKLGNIKGVGEGGEAIEEWEAWVWDTIESTVPRVQ